MDFKLQTLSKLLDKFSKGIPVYGKNVHIISSPHDFFSILLAKTERSKKIVLTSLYLGNGNLETAFVDALYNRARKCKIENDAFDLRVLLDGNRGLRGAKNSCSMLSKIKQDFSSMVNIAFYQTPHLRPWMKWLMRGRLNETIGLQHMKFYMFDNTVIISGANLSNDYFLNRQDRYFVFENCPVLCEYIEKLVKTVSSFSLILQSDGSLGLDPGWNLHPSKCTAARFSQAAARKVYDEGLCMSAAVDSDLFVHRRSLIKRLFSYIRKAFEISGNNYQPVPILERISLYNSEIEENQRGPADAESSGAGAADTVVYPLVGMGPLGIHADSRATGALLASAGGARAWLATGYFNLTDTYQSLLLQSRAAAINILVASPKANGFFDAGGAAGHIPSTYVHLTEQFFNRIKRSGSSAVKISEYFRPGWTFHAKGLWLYESGSSLPSVSLIGSSNFGYRSVSRDLELQLAILTTNKRLQEAMHEEKCSLFSGSSVVTDATFQREDCQIPVWVRFVMPVLKLFF